MLQIRFAFACEHLRIGHGFCPPPHLENKEKHEQGFAEIAEEILRIRMHLK